MRTTISLLAFSAAPLFALSAPPSPEARGCPHVEKAAQAYFTENFGGDDEKPVSVKHKIMRINNAVAAVEYTAPEDREDKDAQQAVFTLFFGGKARCELVFQTDGAIAEVLDAGATKYVFVRIESDEGDIHRIDDQVITATPEGEVTPTRDQHGGDIYFSQTIQKRCGGKAGETIMWSRDNADTARLTLRQRHTDRDGKCRLIEDSSSYRYYRLTAVHWELDDGEAETVAEDDIPNSHAPVVHLKTPVRKR